MPTVTLSGSGVLTQPAVTATLSAYSETDIKVVIEGYQKIEDWALPDYENIIEIEISDSVTEIGHGAFQGCGFTEVSIPDSVLTMGNSVFSQCEKLTSVKLPKYITILERLTFAGCKALTSCTVPSNITTIGGNAFGYCTRLKNLVLSDNITVIEAQAFEGCTALESIIIPKSVTNIKAGVFKDWTSSQIIYMEHDDPLQLFWGNPPTEPRIVFGYTPPPAGTSESTTPLNVNLRKTVIDISQPTFLSIVINPNTAGLEVISDDYYIQSNNNCPIQVSLVDFGLSDADDSGYQLVAPTSKTWANVPHTEKVLALGIKHNSASELSNGVELTNGNTFWATDIDEPVTVCEIAAKKRATFELIAQHGYSVDNDRTLTVEIVPLITLAPPPIIHETYYGKVTLQNGTTGVIYPFGSRNFNIKDSNENMTLLYLNDDGTFQIDGFEAGMYWFKFTSYPDVFEFEIVPGAPQYREYFIYV